MAIHFPRRRTWTMSILLRFRARLTSRSCPRRNPERISQRAAFNLGKISISNSLNKFAVTTSSLAGGFHRRTSKIRNRTPSILFSRAFSFAVEIATGSWSIPITRLAPRTFAASARIPLPVPRSTIDSGERRRPACKLRRLAGVTRVRRAAEHHRPAACAPQTENNFSSNRRHIAVVACSPVPNAAPAGITRNGGFRKGVTAFQPSNFSRRLPKPSLLDLTTTRRFPIFSGALFCPREAFQPIAREFFHLPAELFRELFQFDPRVRSNFDLRSFPIRAFDDRETFAGNRAKPLLPGVPPLLAHRFSPQIHAGL